MSRLWLNQAGMRVMQVGMKEQRDTSIKSLRDSNSSSARRLSAAIDSNAFKAAKEEKLKQAEESLRTVMYLSCWGPNS